MALQWTLPDMSTCVSYWGACNWTLHFRCTPSAEGKDHLPQPAGNALPNAVQDIITVACGMGTLMAHVQLGVHQNPQALFCEAAFHLGSPQQVMLLA